MTHQRCYNATAGNNDTVVNSTAQELVFGGKIKNINRKINQDLLF